VDLTRIEVDIVACDGRGICAEVLPERIRLDDWGYPMLDPTPITPDLAKRADQAVKLCPKLALRLTPVESPVIIRR
jgi:ferredoxin